MKYLFLLCALLFFAAPVGATPRFGFIDSDGQWIIRPEYRFLTRLGPGLYAATTFKDDVEILDSHGKEIVVPRQSNISMKAVYLRGAKDFCTKSDLFLLISDPVTGKFGVINASGQTIVPLAKWFVESYSDGYFLVQTAKGGSPVDPAAAPGTEYNDQYHTIFDDSGKAIGTIDTAHEFRVLSDHFGNGVVQVKNELGPDRIRFFDVTGQELPIPFQKAPIDFCDGFACIKDFQTHRPPPLDGNYSGSECYIDKQGHTLADATFEYCSPFIGGYAVVCRGMRYGVIDRKGNVRIPIIYNGINHFAPSEFFAEKSDHRWVSLDVDGHVLRTFPLSIEPLYKNGEVVKCTIHVHPSKSLWNDTRGIIDKYNRVSESSGNRCESTIPSVFMVEDSDGNQRWGLRNNQKCLVKPTFYHLWEADPNLWIAAVEPSEFTAAEWQHGPKPLYGFDRSALFAKFLQKYNLIGMPRAKVNELLGTERAGKNSDRFGFTGSGCGNGTTDIFVEYENGRVRRWCFRGFLDFGCPNSGTYHWFDKNVIFVGKRNDLKSDPSKYAVKVTQPRRAHAGDRETRHY